MKIKNYSVLDKHKNNKTKNIILTKKKKKFTKIFLKKHTKREEKLKHLNEKKNTEIKVQNRLKQKIYHIFILGRNGGLLCPA